MSTVLKCSHCSYVTTRTYNLTRHMKTHDIPCQNQEIQTAENVNMLPTNVVMSPTNVVMPPTNVVIPPTNVVIEDNTEMSTRFQCNTCYKSFSRKYLLTKHKRVCQAVISPLMCPKCFTTYADRASKSKHVKHCKGVLACTDGDNSINTTNNIQNQQVNINITNNINNSIVNSQVGSSVHVNSLGEEDVQHITTAFKDARLKEFHGKGILNYIKSVHFNPELPQNHNIRKHEDPRFCNVREGGSWIIQSLSSMLSELVSMYQYKLKERMLNPGFRQSLDSETTWDVIYKNFLKFDQYTNTTDYYRVIRDLTALLENLENSYKVPTTPQLPS